MILASDQYALYINDNLQSCDEWATMNIGDAPEYGAHSNGDKMWTSTPRDKKQRRLTIGDIFINSNLYASLQSMIGQLGEETYIKFVRLYDKSKEPLTFSYKVIVVQDFKYPSPLSSKDGERGEMLCSVDIDVLDNNNK